ncbi:hypothetical protein BGZ63DRAFT_386986 [Mariannaea sp. PMI_226]|nr:hypothetical protein BGZ63DRAFT_386986 [Mariannaea sp. PMI_226]
MGRKIELLPQSRTGELKIDIDHHYASKAYTTGDPIAGTVTFTPRRDTPFEKVQIRFLGLARVRVENPGQPKISTHLFLRTDMPESDLVYPGSKVFRAHETYIMPFYFIVPDYLTTHACRHKVDSDYISNCHACLPPSIGTWEKDDMTVNSSSVEYSIQANIITSSGKKSAAISNQHIINILPYSPEQPPLDVTPINIQYRMQNDKKIRKSVISTVSGRLRAVASQPRAIDLSPDGTCASDSAIHISLAFESKSAGVVPPKISNASVGIESQTWSRQSPSMNFPNMGLLHDAYTQHTTIQSKTPVQASWEPNTMKKEDAESVSEPATSHTATVEIPFTIPMSKKMWVPTFHNCLISRTYKLNVNLDVGNTTLRFNIPLQISMETLDLPMATAMGDWTTGSFDVEQIWPEENETYSRRANSLRKIRALGAADTLPDYHA